MVDSLAPTSTPRSRTSGTWAANVVIARVCEIIRFAIAHGLEIGARTTPPSAAPADAGAETDTDEVA